MNNKRILYVICLVSIVLPGFLASQNRSILLWNGLNDSAIVKNHDNIVIAINNKTCKDCLGNLVTSLQTKPKINAVWITLQTSQPILTKRSIRNDFRDVSECSKCRFFINNNLHDSLLNANIQTPIVFKQEGPALKIYQYTDCFEYNGLVKKEFLQKITE